MSLDKPLGSVTQADLQTLIADRVAESQRIEYKQLIPANDHGRDEFRRDVTSFANAVGGHLLIGVREEQGLPVELVGIPQSDPDRYRLSLDDMVRANVRPRLVGLGIQPVPIEGNRWVVVVRTPKSFNPPHEVWVAKDDFQFWSRNSGGNYRLDVDEIRAAVLASESLPERIRSFRMNRLGMIAAGDTPATMDAGAKLILHIVPVSAFASDTANELLDLTLDPSLESLEPLRPLGWSCEAVVEYPRYNFDGIVVAARSLNTETSTSYLQVFRSGAVETVNSSLFSTFDGGFLRLTSFESEILQTITRVLALFQRLEISHPILVMTSLIGVAGYQLLTENYRGPARTHPIDRDALVVPDVIIGEQSDDLARVLRPVFDQLWNAGGIPRSPNYNRDGIRI